VILSNLTINFPTLACSNSGNMGDFYQPCVQLFNFYIMTVMGVEGIIKTLNAQAGAVSGICLSFNGWALKKKGPVFVSMFSPIGTVCSVIFSVVTLEDTINIGRYIVKIPS